MSDRKEMSRSHGFDDMLRNAWCHLFLSVLFIQVVGCGEGQSFAVEKEKLQFIKDHSSPRLQDGYRELFDSTVLASAASIEKAGKSVSYDDLLKSPDQFRGVPITIEGVLWRLFQLADQDLVTFNEANESISCYEAWILDGNGQAYRVIVPKLSADLTVGAGLRSVRVTGYFAAIECHELSHSKEFGVDFATVSIPMLFAPRIVPTAANVAPELKVRLVEGRALPEVRLPAVKVGLRADEDGKLTELTFMNGKLGHDDKAFERLNRSALMVIGRPGNPLAKELEALIDADANCSYADVAKAVSACVGQDRRYIENIRFAVPHKPRVKAE